jgi:hypothetical protein
MSYVYLTDRYQLAYIGVIWSAFDFLSHHGFFVHQWNLPGSSLVDLGLVRTVPT